MKRVFLAFPTRNQWKQIPGNLYSNEFDFLNDLIFYYDIEKGIFYPRSVKSPDYQFFKSQNPVYDYIWIEDEDFDNVINNPMSIVYGGSFSPATNVYCFLINRKQDGRAYKIIWDDQLVERGTLKKDDVRTRDDYADVNLGLVLLSDGKNILFIHPDFYNYREHDEEITFSDNMNLPMLSEKIISTNHDFSLRTVIFKDYCHKKFILIGPGDYRWDNRENQIITGYYKISEGNLVIYYYNYNGRINLYISTVLEVKEQDCKITVFDILIYSNGQWNHPSPPTQAINLLEKLMERASAIIETPLDEYEGSVWENTID